MKTPMIRQGDVLLQKVDKQINILDATEATVDPKVPGRVVLAYGEATGHHHSISTDYAKMYEWKGDRLLEVKEGAVLEHQEHSAITLEPGVYKVVQQREFDPSEESESRFVLD